MKIQKINTILDVKRFAVTKQSLFKSSLNNDLFKDNEIIINDIDGNSIYKLQNSIIQIFQKEKGYFYYINDELLISNLFLLTHQVNEGIFAETNSNRISRGNYLRDIILVDRKELKKIKTLLKQTKFKLAECTNNSFVVSDTCIIVAYTIENPKTPSWKYPLSKLGHWTNTEGNSENHEIQQILGVYDDLLWIFLKRGLFIALDMNTGSLKHKFEGVHSSNKIGEVDEYLGEKDIYQFFFRTSYIMDKEKGRIIGLAADRYYVIDLKQDNPVPKLYGIWRQMEELGIKKENIGYNPVLQGDLLYFIMIEQGRFGILDTISKEIIYLSEHIQIDDKKGRWAELKEIQVSGDEVYVLSSDNVLHVYRQEIDN